MVYHCWQTKVAFPWRGKVEHISVLQVSRAIGILMSDYSAYFPSTYNNLRFLGGQKCHLKPLWKPLKNTALANDLSEGLVAMPLNNLRPPHSAEIKDLRDFQ